MLTQDLLNKLFEYRDGFIYRKNKPNVYAGTFTKHGYYRVSINCKLYYVHRIIYMMFYGYFPEQIDHIDGNRGNNKIENLRNSNNTQNNQNKPITKANKSGCKNVYWHSAAKKWSVEIKSNGKKCYLGLFDDIELADLVATEARNKYHGSFARHY